MTEKLVKIKVSDDFVEIWTVKSDGIIKLKEKLPRFVAEIDQGRVLDILDKKGRFPKDLIEGMKESIRNENDERFREFKSIMQS